MNNERFDIDREEYDYYYLMWCFMVSHKLYKILIQ